MDLNRHTETVALPGNESAHLKESSESLSLHLANLFTGRTVTGFFRSIGQGTTSDFSQLPVLETVFICQGPPSWVFSPGTQHSTWAETMGWLLGSIALEEKALGTGTHRHRLWHACFAVLDNFNKTVSLSTEWGYCHRTHRTRKKINKEGIRTAEGDLACHRQLWKAVHIAKPPPESGLGFQAFTKHLENVSFLPRHGRCTWVTVKSYFLHRILDCHTHPPLHMQIRFKGPHFTVLATLPHFTSERWREGNNPNGDLIPITSSSVQTDSRKWMLFKHPSPWTGLTERFLFSKLKTATLCSQLQWEPRCPRDCNTNWQNRERFLRKWTISSG